MARQSRQHSPLSRQSIIGNGQIGAVRRSTLNGQLGQDGQRARRYLQVLAEGQSIDNFYEIAPTVMGEGMHGKVVMAMKLDKQGQATDLHCAIKSIQRKTIKDTNRFDNEAEIRLNMDHPNVAKLYAVFLDERKAYLVMELCAGCLLFDKIIKGIYEAREDGTSFDEKERRWYMKQIMAAVAYIHSQHFAHRDLKLENFMISEKGGVPALQMINLTFGKDTRLPFITQVGTPYYIAPEVLQGAYDEKCDVWSCGVLAYVLLCGYPPFHGETDRQAISRAKSGNFVFQSPDWDPYSPACKDFISHMLVVNPAKRPSAASCCEHTWLTSSSTDFVAVEVDAIQAKMRNFRSRGKMERVVLTIIAQQLGDHDIEELRQAFVAADFYKAGTLTPKQMRMVMGKQALELPDDLEELLTHMNDDRSGKIDYAEFVVATKDAKLYAKREILWAVFKTFDIDGNGTITKQELAQVVGDGDGAEQMIAEMLKDADLNGDGEIDFEEFCTLIS